MKEIVLTRYLYLKSAVINSLKIAIQESDKKKAFFWAYELYRSGFQTEVIQILFSILEDEYKMFQNLKKCLQNKYEKWKKDYKSYPEFVGTMILNMIHRNIYCHSCEKKPVIVVGCKLCDIAEYETQNITVGKSWQYLRNCCIYSAIGDAVNCGNIYQNMNSQTQWLYYASHSPIWNMRLQKYHIKIDHVVKDVVFDSDDVFEKFMDKFGFEPDEQCLNIQYYCLGISS
jgi:hypothetical protein